MYFLNIPLEYKLVNRIEGQYVFIGNCYINGVTTIRAFLNENAIIPSRKEKSFVERFYIFIYKQYDTIEL